MPYVKSTSNGDAAPTTGANKVQESTARKEATAMMKSAASLALRNRENWTKGVR